MSLSLLSPPMNEPIALDDIKSHLRISNSDDDTAIAGLQVAARHALEARSGVAFLPQQWRFRTKKPASRDIILPVTPVLSIDEVRLIHADGTQTELDEDAYSIELGSIGRIHLTNAPTSLLTLNGRSHTRLEIVFTAGYNSNEAIPEELRHAIRLLTAHFFETRESASENRVFSIPRSIDALLAPYRRIAL